MLSPNNLTPLLLKSQSDWPARQHGVVLMISLIILVALTIGGIALVRSVGTTNIIAGNLAFQQAATLSGEAGTEAAIRSIEVGNPSAMTSAALQSDNFVRGYAASTPAGVWTAAGDAAGTPADWGAYWDTVINPINTPVVLGCSTGTLPANGRVCVLPPDSAGNTVSYTIQRLCQTAGDPLLKPTGCASGTQKSALSGSSLGSGSIPLPQVTQYYYRITTRIAGPRNTVSYIQTIVAR